MLAPIARIPRPWNRRFTADACHRTTRLPQPPREGFSSATAHPDPAMPRLLQHGLRRNGLIPIPLTLLNQLEKVLLARNHAPWPHQPQVSNRLGRCETMVLDHVTAYQCPSAPQTSQTMNSNSPLGRITNVEETLHHLGRWARAILKLLIVVLQARISKLAIVVVPRLIQPHHIRYAQLFEQDNVPTGLARSRDIGVWLVLGASEGDEVGRDDVQVVGGRLVEGAVRIDVEARRVKPCEIHGPTEALETVQYG
mmetsp:Transcript_30202/g.76027  ORF Transcript_30202/g.76027 Transcript_30202/m.76027 type:complete len:253 (-) Transcript_30202:589-1347(-)